jgi:hypothetical protein
VVINIKNKKILIISITLITLLLLSSTAILAKSNIYIQGTEGYYNNPALNKADKTFEINLGGYGTFSNNGINSKYLNQHLDENDKDEILGNIDNGELILMGEGSQKINIKYNNLTIFTGLTESGVASIPKDAIEILLKGNELDREYSLEGTQGGLALYIDSGLSYSMQNKALAEQFNAEEVRLGATVHYLSGGIANLTGEGSFTLTYSDTISGSGKIKAEYAKEATGYAVDFGLNTFVNDKLAWGASIKNIGSLTADTATYYEYEYDPVEEKFVETKDQPLDSLKYRLPIEFNLGTKYRWTKHTSLIGSYSLTNYNSGYTDHKISGGIEYKRIKFLPVSLGVTYSSLQGNMILSSGAALNLGFMHAKITFSDLQALFNGSQSISLGLSSGFSF